MKDNCISNWGLFISSYLPLYVWLLYINSKQVSILLNFNIQFKTKITTENLFVLALLLLIIISSCEIESLLSGKGTELKPLPKNMVVNPESDSLMNYVVTYFTPLVSLNIHDSNSILMNACLFGTIGFMYVGSSATYLNPVLGMFGYKIFRVSGYPNVHHIISELSFSEIETAKKRGDDVKQYPVGDGVYMIKPNKKKHKIFFAKKR